MKLYCTERQNCGYVEVVDIDPRHMYQQPLICPKCYSLLLAYEDNDTPIFVKSFPPQQTTP